MSTLPSPHRTPFATTAKETVMADFLFDYVNALAQRAGWSVTAPDGEGIYHFYLEDGIDLDIRSPDGRNCIVSADLGSEPDASSPQAASELQKLGRIAAAGATKRPSVLSLAKGRLELYRRLDLRQVSQDRFIEQVRDFLNDQMWWKNVLSGNAPSSSPFSAFSAGADWFPSQMQF